MASIQKGRVDTFYVGRIRKNSETGKFVGTVVWVSRFQPQSPAATELRPMNPIRITLPISSAGSPVTDYKEVSAAPTKTSQTITESAPKPVVIDAQPVRTRTQPKRETWAESPKSIPAKPAKTWSDFRQDPLDPFEF